MLSRFSVVVFDEVCAETMKRLQQKHRAHKRYADLMIAAMTLTGGHVLVTRNQVDFVDLLPKAHLSNWIDDPPA
jgi:predicted nucleic acid-binding protein